MTSTFAPTKINAGPLKQYMRVYGASSEESPDGWSGGETSSTKVGDIYVLFSPAKEGILEEPGVQLEVNGVALVYREDAFFPMNYLLDEDNYEMSFMEGVLSSKASEAKEANLSFYCLRASILLPLSKSLITSLATMEKKYGGSGERRKAGQQDPLFFFLNSLGLDLDPALENESLTIGDIALALWCPSKLSPASKVPRLANFYSSVDEEEEEAASKAIAAAASASAEKQANEASVVSSEGSVPGSTEAVASAVGVSAESVAVENGGSVEKLAAETVDTEKGGHVEKLAAETIDTEKGGSVEKLAAETVDTEKVGHVEKLAAETVDTEDGGSVEKLAAETVDTEDGGSVEKLAAETVDTDKGGSVEKLAAETVDTEKGGRVESLAAESVDTEKGGRVESLAAASVGAENGGTAETLAVESTGAKNGDTAEKGAAEPAGVGPAAQADIVVAAASAPLDQNVENAAVEPTDSASTAVNANGEPVSSALDASVENPPVDIPMSVEDVKSHPVQSIVTAPISPKDPDAAGIDAAIGSVSPAKDTAISAVASSAAAAENLSVAPSTPAAEAGAEIDPAVVPPAVPLENKNAESPLTIATSPSDASSASAIENRSAAALDDLTASLEKSSGSFVESKTVFAREESDAVWDMLKPRPASSKRATEEMEAAQNSAAAKASADPFAAVFQEKPANSTEPGGQTSKQELTSANTESVPEPAITGSVADAPVATDMRDSPIAEESTALSLDTPTDKGAIDAKAERAGSSAESSSAAPVAESLEGKGSIEKESEVVSAGESGKGALDEIAGESGVRGALNETAELIVDDSSKGAAADEAAESQADLNAKKAESSQDRAGENVERAVEIAKDSDEIVKDTVETTVKTADLSADGSSLDASLSVDQGVASAVKGAVDADRTMDALAAEQVESTVKTPEAAQAANDTEKKAEDTSTVASDTDASSEEGSEQPARKTMSLQATLEKLEEQKQKSYNRLADFRNAHESAVASGLSDLKEHFSKFESEFNERLKDLRKSVMGKLRLLSIEADQKLSLLVDEGRSKVEQLVPRAKAELEEAKNDKEINDAIATLQVAADQFASTYAEQLSTVLDGDFEKALAEHLQNELAHFATWRSTKFEAFLNAGQDVFEQVRSQRVTALANIEASVNQMVATLQSMKVMDESSLLALEEQLNHALEQKTREAEDDLKSLSARALVAQILPFLAELKTELARTSHEMRISLTAQLEKHSDDSLAEFDKLLSSAKDTMAETGKSVAGLKASFEKDGKTKVDKLVSSLSKHLDKKHRELIDSFKADIEPNKKETLETRLLKRAELFRTNFLAAFDDSLEKMTEENKSQEEELMANWNSQADTSYGAKMAEFSAEIESFKNRRRESIAKIEALVQKHTENVEAIAAEFIQ